LLHSIRRDTGPSARDSREAKAFRATAYQRGRRDHFATRQHYFESSRVMEIAELLLKAWPVLLGLVTLIIVLSKLDLRVAVLEEKIKSAFEIINKLRDK
jgi:hypothetical protein